MNRYLPDIDNRLLKIYADLVVKLGVALYPGQKLLIGCGISDYGFALMLADSAYEAGASFVKIDAGSNYLGKSRIKHSSEEYLSYLPEFLTAQYNEHMADDWALIRIDNTAEIDVMEGVDSDKLEQIARAGSIKALLLRQHMSKHLHTWCVIASPNEKWAEHIYGDKTGDSLSSLWNVLIKVLRLDTDDPVRAWKQHGDTLRRRSSWLNDNALTGLHFSGPGTDLTIKLCEQSMWIGGPCTTPDGRTFIPNMPTEEIFTTPDYRKTEGRVQVTRPVKVMETLVEGAWFEFKNGKVENFGADTGSEILGKYLAVDDGSSYAGEIALVDSTSPIFKSGLIFSSILYDENASCHLALGNGYPTCLKNGSTLRSKEQLRSAGCNVSLVHRDFMISSPDVSVDGILASGEKIAVIKKGNFVR